MSNAGGQKEGANRVEEEKKKGRPDAVASLGRDRSHILGSATTMLDLWKRKREKDADEIQERERVFGKSREELKIGLEEVKGQVRGIRKKMEKIKGEMTRREEQWEVERGEMKETIRDLSKRLEEVKERRGGEMERVKGRLAELEKKSAEDAGRGRDKGMRKWRR
ncbi:uncharacterized protein [Neodiprion pinetum]|uniref:uncharacterized protein n=1 Tax=Neodiprion pinetum TaxID=441929 RepID=UPI00371EC481